MVKNGLDIMSSFSLGHRSVMLSCQHLHIIMNKIYHFIQSTLSINTKLCSVHSCLDLSRVYVPSAMGCCQDVSFINDGAPTEGNVPACSDQGCLPWDRVSYHCGASNYASPIHISLSASGHYSKKVPPVSVNCRSKS